MLTKGVRPPSSYVTGIGTSRNVEGLLSKGIPVFEVSYKQKISNEQFIPGVINALAQEISDESRSIEVNYNIVWMTGKNSGVTFYPNDQDIGTAYVPDDPWWRNRIMMMEDPWWLNHINYLRMPGNRVIPGDEAAIQIKILERMLKVKVPIFKVYNDRFEESDFFYSKEEAENYIKDRRDMYLRTDPPNHRQYEKWSKYKVVPGEILKFNKETEAMIHNEKRTAHQFGWTQCPQFQEIKRQCIEKMENELSGSLAGEPAEFNKEELAKSIIDSLSEDKILEILKEKTAKKKVGAVPEII